MTLILQPLNVHQNVHPWRRNINSSEANSRNNNEISLITCCNSKTIVTEDNILPKWGTKKKISMSWSKCDFEKSDSVKKF